MNQLVEAGYLNAHPVSRADRHVRYTRTQAGTELARHLQQLADALPGWSPV